MATISKSSATIAGLYSIFISLVIVLIFNFVFQGIVVPANVAFGAALIVLALLNALAGVTSQDPDESLLRSFQLSLAVLWAGVGVYHVTEGTLGTGVTPAQALFAGYGAYLLIFIVYVIGALQHRCKFTAILALGFGLSCIFEIASLWRPLRNSSAAYYILLSLLVLYGFMARIFAKFRSRKEEKKPEIVLIGPHNSRDYVPLGHAMNTLAFAVFAGHVTRVFPSSSTEFHWVLVAGAAQTLAAIVAVRRGDAFHGSYFLLYGMFWLANAFNMAVEYVTGGVLAPLIAVYVIYIIAFFIIAVVSLTREIYQFLQNLAICIFCIAICVDGYQGNFIGGMGWVCFILSLYGLLAHMTRIKSGSFKLPLGVRLFEAKKLKTLLVDRCRCFASCLYGKLRETGRDNRLFSRDFMLGYSKYLDLDTACFALNAVSALAILWVPNGLEVLPWVIGFGGLPQMIIGSIAFSRGLTFEACAFFTFASLWVIWGPARGFNVVTADNTVASAIGCIAFLIVGLLLLGLSLVINKAWAVLTFIFNLMVLAFLLTTLAIPGTNVFEVVIVILFVLVCLYCFLASALKAVWGHEVLPLGKPVLQISFLHSQGERAFWADARRASGVTAIADIMNRGGIVGIPTDVVYVLVAACKFPKSVERAYNTKKLAEDRPMSMWISRVEQVEAGRELFGELVWAFMSEVWPSTISLVLPKGPWLDSLGIGYAEKYIGRPDSIAVRMPDNTVTSYLLDQTGPVATSSANPTGEADTLHHLQVLAKLGLENCDGILCSGPSPENMASTVVDCRKLSQGGQLGFFRIGVVPKSRVEQLFVRAQEKHRVVTSLPGSVTNLSERSSDSGMGGPEDNGNDNADNGDNGDEKQVSDLEGGQDNPAYSSDAYEYPEEEQGRRYSRSDIPRSSLYSDPDSPAAPASPLSRASSAYQRTSTLQGASRSGHASDDSVELASLRSDGNPYEPMSRVGSALIQASRQIGGKQPCSEPHTRVNPLYSEVSQKL